MMVYLSETECGGSKIIDQDGNDLLIDGKVKVFHRMINAFDYCQSVGLDWLLVDSMYRGYMMAKARSGKWAVILESGGIAFSQLTIRKKEDCQLAIDHHING